MEWSGSLRESWEGRDESYIQKVKRELKTMRHTDQFVVTILRKLISTTVFSTLNKDTPHNNKVNYERTSNIKIYPLSKGETPGSILENNSIVVGVVDQRGRLMVCSKRDRTGEICLHPVMFEDSGGLWCYDLWYARSTIGPDSEKCRDLKELLGRCSDCFLLLKQEELGPGENSVATGRHTVVCRSWRVRVNTAS